MQTFGEIKIVVVLTRAREWGPELRAREWGTESAPPCQLSSYEI